MRMNKITPVILSGGVGKRLWPISRKSSPKHKLSLQKHMYRSEHWTIVQGVANITLNKKSIVLKKNESVYIPQEAIHRIENKTKQILVIIETQIGDKLSEDDIIRYDDPYKR